MVNEVYHHVPDLSWSQWSRVVLPLYERLRIPMTIDEVVSWSLGSKFDVEGQKMSFTRRQVYARQMLAWLSLHDMIDHAGGKWRRFDSCPVRGIAE